MLLKKLTALLAFISLSTPAHAAFFSFAYEGTVQSSPSGGAVTVSGTAWEATTGIALPDYAYEQGDRLEIQFSGTIPSPGTIAPDTDGLIRSRVVGSIGPVDFPGAAIIDDVRLNGLNGNREVPGLFGIRAMTIAYDPNADSYSLEIGDQNNVFVGTFNLPVYELSENEQGERTARLVENPNILTQLGWSNAMGSAPELLFSGTDISFGSPNTLNGFSGPLRVTGGFGNLSIDRDDPVNVPAPSALLLFGAGAGALAWRRRRHAIAAS